MTEQIREQETEQELLTQKVMNASDSELVVMLLEGMMNRFDDGITAVIYGEPEKLQIAVDKVRAILAELLATLWGNSEVAISTRQIYMYLNKLVTDSGNRGIKEPLEEAKQVLKPLLDAWQQVARNPQPMTAYTRGPSIVAGMTYGKGTLNESVLNSDERLGKG